MPSSENNTKTLKTKLGVDKMNQVIDHEAGLFSNLGDILGEALKQSGNSFETFREECLKNSGTRYFVHAYYKEGSEIRMNLKILQKLSNDLLVSKTVKDKVGKEHQVDYFADSISIIGVFCRPYWDRKERQMKADFQVPRHPKYNGLVNSSKYAPPSLIYKEIDKEQAEILLACDGQAWWEIYQDAVAEKKARKVKTHKPFPRQSKRPEPVSQPADLTVTADAAPVEIDPPQPQTADGRFCGEKEVAKVA